MLIASRVVFAWVFVTFMSLIQLSLAANECSFVRSHKNEQCVYNIHLTQENGPCEEARGRRHFRRHLNTQSDYDEKIDIMEKEFTYMKDEHEKRLKDLEGTMRDLLASPDAESLASLVETSVDHNLGTPKRGRSLDNTVLSRLHQEFGKLRAALRKKTEEIFDLHHKLNETEKMFEKSQEDLYSVNQDLLNAENKIAILERERAVLKNQVKDRSYKLDVSNNRLSETEQKLSNQQEQLFTLIRSENTLSEGLMTCELVLNMTKVEMKKVETRHRHMKARHNRVKEVLAVREQELIECYAAKTQTFCGFEDPQMCGFKQPNDSKTDFFDWEWGQGITPSAHTGPSADHTCGTKQGHFMFIEASAKGRGKNAIIYSPLYRGLFAQCLQFYYHMNGQHVGTLNVYAKARGGDELSSVWRAWGNQGDIWSVARLSIPKELARAGYQIAFEGITEDGYKGDMAIDDISVNDGACGGEGGVQAVVVQFNSSSLVKESKKFARNMKKFKLSRVPRGKRKKGSRKHSPHANDSGK